MPALGLIRRWRREAAWVDAERRRQAAAWFPYSNWCEAENARLEAQGDPETGREFEVARWDRVAQPEDFGKKDHLTEEQEPWRE